MQDYTQLALNAGLPPDLAQYANRYVQIESGGDPNQQTGKYTGALQMGPDEIAKYGDNSAASGFRMYADNAKWFQNKYGRQPSPTELYMVAQQGQGGIANHLASPDQPAWQNMLNTAEGQKKGAGWAKQAIWGNVPDDLKAQYGNVNNVSSQDFLNLWQHKVERTPMNVAFNAKQQQQGTTMPDQSPSLYSRVLAGGPGALFGAPGGVFPGSDGGQGGGYDLGLALERAGAGITGIANPAGGAAMMNAANMPLFRQRFTVIRDGLGRQYRMDIHTGAVTPLTPGATAPGAGASGAGAPMTQQDILAQSPVSLEAQTKAQAESDQKKMDALEEASGNAQDMIDLIKNQAMPLSKNPNVYQGPGGNLVSMGKSALRNTAGVLGIDAGKGAVETADLDKLNAQLQAKMLAAQKGVRFAGPEIKFGQTANADISKPDQTNQQIYSNLLQQAERIQYATKLARQFRAQGKTLGPEYHAALQQYMDQNPIYQPDQLPNGGASATGSALPKGVRSIQVIQ